MGSVFMAPFVIKYRDYFVELYTARVCGAYLRDVQLARSQYVWLNFTSNVLQCSASVRNAQHTFLV